jgi:dTDP-glucose 4,6-dehydratase
LGAKRQIVFKGGNSPVAEHSLKLLVTGGAGFIGSNFIRYILKNYPDYQVVNLDKLTYAGNLENLKDVEKNPNYKFVKGDINDSSLVFELCQGVDAVLNFAAESHVDRSIKEPQEFVKTNVFGTNTLLLAAREAKVSRFIQVSTDEVYGSIKEGSFKEEDPLQPSSPYSASKAGADLLALSYFKTYRFPVLVTRSSNNFGPYQYPEKLIPLMITNALEDKPLPVYGDGMNVRDWLYVEDNCAAIDLVLHKGKEGEIYNIGAGNEYPNIQIVREILRILGKPESLIKFVEDRPGHDFRYSVDWSKVKSLGFEPKRSFKEALEETVVWYRENEWWWRPLKK